MKRFVTMTAALAVAITAPAWAADRDDRGQLGRIGDAKEA